MIRTDEKLHHRRFSSWMIYDFHLHCDFSPQFCQLCSIRKEFRKRRNWIDHLEIRLGHDTWLSPKISTWNPMNSKVHPHSCIEENTIKQTWKFGKLRIIMARFVRHEKIKKRLTGILSIPFQDKTLWKSIQMYSFHPNESNGRFSTPQSIGKSSKR